MLDIIPAGPRKQGQHPSKAKRSSEHEVHLTWKLPSRLSQPIRQELAKEKDRQKRRQDIVQFERRSITTKLPSESPPNWRSKRQNVGAEFHTGDVYMKSRPAARLPVPPYSQRMPGREDAVRPSAPRVARRPPNRSGASIAAERDVPYEFAAQDRASAVLLPGNRLSRPGRAHRAKPKRRLRWMFPERLMAFNLGVLLVGCLLLYGLVWNLQGVSRGIAVLGPVRERAMEAYDRLIAGSAALAENDFAASERNFTDAAVLLAAAQSELDGALASSRAIVRYLDVTGTVRSGEELLVAGSALTKAGEHVSRGMSLLLEDSGYSLSEAIEAVQIEFGLGVQALAEAEAALDNVGGLFIPSEIEEQVAVLQTGIPQIKVALQAFLDQSDILLAVLGTERERQYLLLFQNNHEMRPTGGFIGSIALINVDRGVVEEIDVQSVYDGDGQLREFIAPPNPLLPITDRWYLRDANWFVDWPTSAQKISDFFEKEGGPTVDGVIAMTPEVVRSLLVVTGPIEVPQYGVTVDVDNFWTVTQDQVTYGYDTELNKPKQFLADLAPLLLQRLFAAPGDSSLQTLSVLMDMVQRKHLLFFFQNDNLQQQLVETGWAGVLPRDQQGFLTVNNANIGGHKSDQFIEQEIDYRLEVHDSGDVDVVVTIRRTHQGPQEALDYEYPPGEDPARKDNIVWQRVLVPAGAELIDAQGFTSRAYVPNWIVPNDDLPLNVDPDLAAWQRGQTFHPSGTIIGREAGYTFFANWVITKPGETSVVLYQYRLPNHARMPSLFDPAERFEALVFKQPGDWRTSVRVALSLPDNMRAVHTVPEDGITQGNPHDIVYRGRLIGDVLVGAVFERAG